MSLRQVCFAPAASGESQTALTEREGLSLAQHDDEDEKEEGGEAGFLMCYCWRQLSGQASN